MTAQEQITALKEALATGSKSVTIGDRSIVYRDFDEIQKILSKLQAEVSTSESSVPFGVIQVSYAKGL